MSVRLRAVALLLGGGYLLQWCYLGLVGFDSGMWDLSYTTAEKKLEKRFPYSQVSVEYFEKAARRAERLEPEDGRLARTYHDLGTLIWLTRSAREGRVYLLRSLEIFRASDGPQSTWVGTLEMRLGEMDLQQGRSAQALERLQRAESILVRTQGNFDLITVRAAALRAIAGADAAAARRVLRWLRGGRVDLDPVTRNRLRLLGGEAGGK